MYGWQGKILRIDLTREEVREEALPMDLALAYLGGGGLNARLLFDEVKADTDPMGPDNVFIIGVGPLVGTLALSCSRWTITSKSPLSGSFGDTNMGGHFGAELKYAGYDHVIIKGKAKEPVYIWIDNDEVEIRKADHLWGQTAWETDDALKEELKDDQIKTAVIGPASEVGIKYGAVICTRYRAGGRGGGMGAVMGSKNLKAIAVRGSKTVKMAHPKKVVEAVDEALASYKSNPMRHWVEELGALALVQVYASMGILPVRGGQTGLLDDERGEAFATRLHTKHEVSKRACFGCPVACVVFHEVREGAYAGTKGEKPELPAAINFSAYHDMPTIEYGIYLTDQCNIYGIDQIEVGAVIGMAFYWYQKGLISKKDTNGLELVWGNEEAAVKLFDKIINREGIGAILALGVKGAVDKMGPEYEPPQGSVKGVAEVMPDVRAAKSFGLGAAISPRGADHLKSLPVLERQPPEVTKELVGSEKVANPLTEDDKHLACAWCEDLKTMLDSVGICLTPTMMIFGGYPPETLAKIFSSVTGVEMTWADLKVCGERGWDIMRCFNVRQGLDRKDDILPAGISTVPKPDGVGAGLTIDLDSMLDNYYKIRGWDANGVPNRQKLEELGMKDIADALGGGRKRAGKEKGD